MCAPNSATLCFNDVNEMHYALNESVRRTCAGAAAVRGQLSVTRSQEEMRAPALGGEMGSGCVCVCALCRVVSGIRADSNVTFSIRKSRFVCITSFVAPEMRQKVA